MYRIQRMGSEIQKNIALIITSKISDPRMTDISVLSADVSPDLKNAKVRVSILKDEKQSRETFDALKRAAGFIRHELALILKDARQIPQLNFVLDKSEQINAHINEIIKANKHD